MKNEEVQGHIIVNIGTNNSNRVLVLVPGTCILL